MNISPLTPELLRQMREYAPPTLNGSDIDIIRALIKTAVDEALHPAGLPDVREHRRIEMVEESGRHWRGILYVVEEEKEL